MFLRLGTISGLLASAGCTAPAVPPEPAPPPVTPAAPTAAPVRAPPPVASARPVCDAPPAPSPQCDGPCEPHTLWSKEYRKRIGTVPAPMQIVADGRGIIIAGQTGRGPTFLGGKLLNTGWPRGFGTAFIAKYDTEGNHMWSRLLFTPTALDKKRGERSGVKAIAVGEDGRIHVLASRVGGEHAGKYLMTLLADGQKATEQTVAKGLPTLMEFAERDGKIAVLGAREGDDARSDLVEYEIEADGSLSDEVRGAVTLPEGIVGGQRAHWSADGVLWTAGWTAGRTGAPKHGGTLTCPIHTTRRERDGSLVRDSSTPKSKQCTWPLSELLVARVTASTAEWMHRFRVPSYRPGSDAAYLDPAGNVYLIGAFTGAALFGEHTLCALELPEGYTEDFFGAVEWDAPCECLRDYADVFLAKVAASGQTAWARRIGDFMEDRAGPVAIAANGVVVAAVGSTPQPDFSVARLRPLRPRWSLVAYGPDGTHLWTHRLKSPLAPVLAMSGDAVVVAEPVEKDAGLRLTALSTTPPG